MSATQDSKPFNILCYGDNEQKARTISAYINDQFVMLDDYPSTVQLVKGKGTYGFDSWDIFLPAQTKQYKKTIQEISTSARDFWNGYTLAQKECKA